MTVKEVLSAKPTEDTIEVQGWVKTKRGSKALSFVDIYDGSTFKRLQIVVPAESGIDLSQVTTGTSVKAIGSVVASPGKEQKVEFRCQELIVLGASEGFPMQPKRHSLEFLREQAHLRPRTDLFSAVFRVRSMASFAIHQFFQEKGYIHVHTPIITGSDCEGAGETFEVVPEDFFGKEVSLTVSGQLHGEMAAMGLGSIYTFGPTFRAEPSFSRRHLSEFWMVEPEVAFLELDGLAELSEEFLKYVISYVMEKCSDEIAFLRDYRLKEESQMKKELRHLPLDAELQSILDSTFHRITYTEAVEILKASRPYKKGKFEYPVEWGLELQTEHEKYLVEKHFKGAVIVTDYPAKCKAFYMKLSDDEKTVRAMDVLLPEIGEIIGGSQREDDLEKLVKRIKDVGIDETKMQWYLDSRVYGTVPHAGFGLGFERLLQVLTGMSSIKDVTLFPRSPKSCQY